MGGNKRPGDSNGRRHACALLLTLGVMAAVAGSANATEDKTAFTRAAPSTLEGLRGGAYSRAESILNWKAHTEDSGLVPGARDVPAVPGGPVVTGGEAQWRPRTLSQPQAPAIVSAEAEIVFVEDLHCLFLLDTLHNPTTFACLGDALPAGLSFNESIGLLSGVPEAGTEGEYQLLFTASNAEGISNIHAVTLTVRARKAPEISGMAAGITLVEGRSASIQVSASNDPLRYGHGDAALPPGMTFDAETGLLSGVPEAGTAGAYPLHFTAENLDGVSQPQSFSLLVRAPRLPVVSVSGPEQFIIGQPDVVTVDASNEPTAFVCAGALPLGISFDPETGVLSGTPAPGTEGEYALSFSAVNRDGVSTAKRVTFTVRALTPPVITTEQKSIIFTEGASASFTVRATNSPVYSCDGTLPAGVSFNSGTGELSGTPAEGSARTYYLTFAAQNEDGMSFPHVFTLTVERMPKPPVINCEDFAVFAEGEPGAFLVTATNDPTAFSCDGHLPAGVLFDRGTGQLVGAPEAGTAGEYPLRLWVSNPDGTSPVQDFTLTVETPGPVITPPPATPEPTQAPTPTPAPPEPTQTAPFATDNTVY